jgi:hypothetical protein
VDGEKTSWDPVVQVIVPMHREQERESNCVLARNVCDEYDAIKRCPLCQWSEDSGSKRLACGGGRRSSGETNDDILARVALVAPKRV